MTPARARILAAAQSCVGIAAPSPEYLAIVAPSDTGARQREIGTESGCALVAMGIWRAAFGLPAPQPYRDGHAFGDLYALAGGSPWTPGGGVRKCGLDAPPQAGDAIVWLHSSGAVDHVDACVVDIEDAQRDYETDDHATSITISVIAGGQRDSAGNEMVKLLARSLRWTGAAWQDTADGRTIFAVVDADMLASHVKWIDPDAVPATLKHPSMAPNAPETT